MRVAQLRNIQERFFPHLSDRSIPPKFPLSLRKTQQISVSGVNPFSRLTIIFADGKSEAEWWTWNHDLKEDRRQTVVTHLRYTYQVAYFSDPEGNALAIFSDPDI